MNIKVDFTEVDAPTAKQVDLVQKMLDVLPYLKKPNYTLQDYRDFIDSYMDDYIVESDYRYRHE